MSKTYKNPNKEKRVRKAESDTHEERRNIKRVLESLEFKNLEDYNQVAFDFIDQDDDKIEK